MMLPPPSPPVTLAQDPTLASFGQDPWWLVIIKIVFAFLFGLSMDYEVFILARMREEYDETGDTTSAIVRGLGFGCLFKRPLLASPFRDRMVELPVKVPPVEAHRVISRAHRVDRAVHDCVEYLITNSMP